MTPLAWIYLGVGLAIAGAGATGAVLYTRAIERAQTAERAAEQWKASQEAWKGAAIGRNKDYLKAQDAAKEARRDAAQGAREVDALRRGLAEAGRVDVDSRSWLGTPVPPAIRRVRRAAAGCSIDDLDLPCPADGAAGADKGAADERFDWRRPLDGIGGVTSRTSAVQ